MLVALGIALSVCAIAIVGEWMVVSNIAFRSNEESTLGRLDVRIVAIALLVVGLLASTRSAYLPDPFLLGVLVATITVCTVTDMRLWQIYNALVAILLVAAIGDAVYFGHVFDAICGLVVGALILAGPLWTRIIDAADAKAALAIAAVLGGFYIAVVVIVGIGALTLLHAYRQRRSPVPLTTRMPWAPFLAAGTVAALALAVTPLAPLLAASRP